MQEPFISYYEPARQETSGLVVLAKNSKIHRKVSTLEPSMTSTVQGSSLRAVHTP